MEDLIEIFAEDEDEIDRWFDGKECVKRKTGRVCICDMWGRMRCEVEYKDGERHGEWSLWYKNGRKMFERHYKDGMKHGWFRAWDVNGQIRVEREYKDGKAHGTWSAIDEKGTIMARTHYSRGNLVK